MFLRADSNDGKDVVVEGFGGKRVHFWLKLNIAKAVPNF